MTISPSHQFPYMYKVRFGFNPEVMAKVKALQGATWHPDKHTWLVPIDHKEALASIFPEAVFDEWWLQQMRGISEALDFEALCRAKRPFQVSAVQRAFSQPSGIILAFEMKLGKSAPALDIARLRAAQNTLIMCPAGSRPTWVREVERWWPEARSFSLAKSPKSLSKTEQLAWKLHQNPDSTGRPKVTILSYGLLDYLEETAFDCIIIDEVHYLTNAKSTQSRAVRETLDVARECAWAQHQDCFIVGLSGTPASNDTGSLYNPLDSIFPKRYGYFYSEKTPESEKASFAGAYMNVSWNGYGHDFNDIDPKSANAEELTKLAALRARIDAVMVRESKAKWAHLLPALDPQSLRKEADFSIKAVVEAEIKGGETGIAVMCYHADTWAKVMQELASLKADGLAVGLISGAETSEKRDQRLQELRQAKVAVVVASIAACAVTIDLSRFNSIHVVELSDKSAQMSQVVGRFQVPGDHVPKTMTFWYDKETFPIAMRLQRKFEVQAAVMGAGASEDQMRKAFAGQTAFSKQEWDEAINDIFSTIL